MAQVKINQVESNINVADADGLLTPELLDKIAHAVAMKIQQQQQLDRLADEDRSLVEGANR